MTEANKAVLAAYLEGQGEMTPESAEDFDPGPYVPRCRTALDVQRAVLEAPGDVNLLRLALGQALRERSWEMFIEPHMGTVYRFPSLRSFVEAPRADGGLQSERRVIEALLATSPEAAG